MSLAIKTESDMFSAPVAHMPLQMAKRKIPPYVVDKIILLDDEKSPKGWVDALPSQEAATYLQRLQAMSDEIQYLQMMADPAYIQTKLMILGWMRADLEKVRSKWARFLQTLEDPEWPHGDDDDDDS